MKYSILIPTFYLLAILLGWQAMHELYKFDDSEPLIVIFAICCCFGSLFMANVLSDNKLKSDQSISKPDPDTGF